MVLELNYYILIIQNYFDKVFKFYLQNNHRKKRVDVELGLVISKLLFRRNHCSQSPVDMVFVLLFIELRD